MKCGRQRARGGGGSGAEPAFEPESKPSPPFFFVLRAVEGPGQARAQAGGEGARRGRARADRGGARARARGRGGGGGTGAGGGGGEDVPLLSVAARGAGEAQGRERVRRPPSPPPADRPPVRSSPPARARARARGRAPARPHPPGNTGGKGGGKVVPMVRPTRECGGVRKGEACARMDAGKRGSGRMRLGERARRRHPPPGASSCWRTAPRSSAATPRRDRGAGGSLLWPSKVRPLSGAGARAHCRLLRSDASVRAPGGIGHRYWRVLWARRLERTHTTTDPTTHAHRCTCSRSSLRRLMTMAPR